jgi:hypothetical protein
MAVLLLTATSRRRTLFTWCCVSKKECRSSSRLPLARRPVFGQVAASPTSFPLEEPVSASHDKSPPRTTSPAPTSAWDPDAQLGHRHRRARRSESPRHAETTAGGHVGNLPDKSLNVGLTSRTTMTSPSSLTLPRARLNPRHSSTLYDAHEPRLRLGRGKLGKHSGRLRQAQTTRGEDQASRREQSNPAASRQGIATRLQCTPTDGGVRRDVPAAKHCNSFLLPLVPSPCDYKRERRATVTRVRPS